MSTGTVLFQVSLVLVAMVVHVRAMMKPCHMIEANKTDVVKFPFVTSIHAKQEKLYAPFCCGSVLNTRWILTAGQCLTKDSSHRTLRSMKTLVVSVGITVMSSVLDVNDKDHVYRPKKLVVHPQMKIRFPQYDLGMIHLERSITLGMRVAKVPMLPRSASRNAGYPNGKVCTVVAWGAGEQSAKRISPSGWNYGDQPLKFFHVNMVAADACDYGLPIGAEGSILCSECATKSNLPCMGDIGAPLMCDGHQVGVVSWSKSCDTADSPVVHTRINTLREWIDQQVFSQNAAREQTSLVWLFLITAKLCI